MDISLAMRAGRVAERLGWDDPVVVSSPDLEGEGPVGAPLVVVCESPLTVDTARTIAALAGAGRAVALVCAEPVPAEAARWLPPGLVDDAVAAPTEDTTVASPAATAAAGQAPRAELAALATDEIAEIRRLVASYDPNDPVLLTQLAADPSPSVRAAVAANPTTPVPVLTQLSDDPRWHVRKTVAENTSTPGSVLEALARDPDGDVREAVAGNTSTPGSALQDLSSDPDGGIREAVASNTSTPGPVLEALEDDDDGAVLGTGWRDAGLAWNPSCPEGLLERLAARPEARIRQNVARNASVPDSLLTRLATDPDADVRGSVAENPRTPVDVLERLAADPDADVRRTVAENPRTPAETLERLSADPDWKVRAGKYGSGGVAANPSAPVTVLDRLASDRAAVRAVSENPRTPAETLERLSSDPLSAVAANPATPVEVLNRLASDHDAGVRRAVAENPRTPAETLERLSNDPEDEVKAGPRVANGRRGGVAANPSTPVDVLDRLASDPDAGVRQSVAENPSLAPRIRSRLRSDPNPRVSTAARVGAEAVQATVDDALDAVRIWDYDNFDWHWGKVAAHALAHLAGDPRTNASDRARIADVLLEPGTMTLILAEFANEFDYRSDPRVAAWWRDTIGPLYARLLPGASDGYTRSGWRWPTDEISDALDGLPAQPVWPRHALEEISAVIEPRNDSVPGYWSRIGIAKNEQASPELLRRIYVEVRRQMDDFMAAGLAGNPASPEGLLRKIADDWIDDADVRDSLLDNPSCPYDLRLRLRAS